MPQDPLSNFNIAQQLILSGLQTFKTRTDEVDRRKALLEKELADRRIQDIRAATDILRIKGGVQTQRAGLEERVAGRKSGEVLTREREAGTQGRFEQSQEDRFELQRREHVHEKQIARIHANTQQSQVDKIVSRGVDNIIKDINKTTANALKVEFGRLGIKAADPEAAIERINNFESEQKITPEEAVEMKRTIALTSLKNAAAERDDLIIKAETSVSEEQRNAYLQMAQTLDELATSRWKPLITEISSGRPQATAAEQDVLQTQDSEQITAEDLPRQSRPKILEVITGTKLPPR